QKNKLFHFYGKTSSMHASLISQKDHFFCFFWNIHEINILKVLHIIFYEPVRAFSPQEYIPFILQIAYVLATLVHPSHIVIYAPGDSLPCRL
ncbi:hypothetical protein D8N63_12105, partial [Salmonella enterica]|nr:hypothetical protein [Salmonella enterica]